MKIDPLRVLKRGKTLRDTGNFAGVPMKIDPLRVLKLQKVRGIH